MKSQNKKKIQNKLKNNGGMTLPELIMAVLMLTAFTGILLLLLDLQLILYAQLILMGREILNWLKMIQLEIPKW